VRYRGSTVPAGMLAMGYSGRGPTVGGPRASSPVVFRRGLEFGCDFLYWIPPKGLTAGLKNSCQGRSIVPGWLL
jgi:hypothetical protein